MATSLCPPLWNHFQTFWPKYFLYLPPMLCTLNLMFLHFVTLKIYVQNTNYILLSQAIFFSLLLLNVFVFVLTYFYKNTHTHTHTRYDSHHRGSAHRRDLYLTTQNIHNSQKLLSPGSGHRDRPLLLPFNSVLSQRASEGTYFEIKRCSRLIRNVAPTLCM